MLHSESTRCNEDEAGKNHSLVPIYTIKSETIERVTQLLCQNCFKIFNVNDFVELNKGSND